MHQNEEIYRRIVSGAIRAKCGLYLPLALVSVVS
jgi:hypothetical protein